MEVNIDNTKWYERILASFIFFTRLPFWRIKQPPQQCYKAVVEHWPLVGWLTGSIMAAIIWLGSMVFPFPIALLIAIVVRILITGALHEDGLADFCDGFGGGGNNRERVLEIMKDSRIGTYGVLGLILYFALLYCTLLHLQPFYAALAVLAGDAYSKMVAGQIIMFLPYARSEETAKNHTVYRKFSPAAGFSLFVQGMLPMTPLLYIGITEGWLSWDLIIFIPCLCMYFLYLFINRRLHGYTGDCCGAMCLLIELSFYLTLGVRC
ncbi:MAG: adenosylcobinamide-GDP ribazoletransferase [Prevotella sp.]|nr:adenosylcobinamide-GDP ribazoletransferase [Prevotella sp.]